jgi:mRNA interferase MazF
MVKKPAYVPKRGDVVWMTMNLQAGYEQAGRRPAVILSPAAYNAKVGLVLAVPVTSRVKGYPFETLVPSGLPDSGAILSNQVKSLDWRARKAGLCYELPTAVVNEVLQKLRSLLT